jgi:TonB-linked SusC/RagA family outer membrane protein
MKKLTYFLLCLIIGIVTAVGQTRVTGKVLSTDDGEPIIGASVVVKGTTVGDITDINGSFTINAPANAKTLVVSYVGMTKVEVDIKPNLVIHLSSDTKHLDEVVVTAMGISREKKSIGYAAQEVKGDELTITPQGDLNNALVGKIAGVRFWGASGATFDAGKVILRGTSTLSAGGNEPIYVVDGVITNVNVVDMNNVESINVLKGPAATAIYGSRGGNGAIIITSKKADARAGGKGTVEFKQSVAWESVVEHAKWQNEYGGGSVGIGNGSRELNVFEYDPSQHPAYLSALNGARYFDMENDISWGARFDGKPYAPWYAWDPQHPKFGQTAPYSAQPNDNLTQLFRTGVTSNTSVSFSKSVGDFTTRVTIGNQQRDGVVDNSRAIRRYLSVNTSYQVNDRLNISADYKYTYRKNHNAMSEDYGGQRDIMYSYTQWFHRDVNIGDLKNYKRPDGTFFTWNPTDAPNGNLTPMFHNNPYAIMNEIESDNLLQWNVLNGTIKYDLVPKVLSIGVTGNANIRSEFGEGKSHFNILGVTPFYSVSQNILSDTQIQAFAQFNKRLLDEKLNLSAHLYVEQRDRDYRSMSSGTTEGLTSDGFFNLAASVGKPSASNSMSQLQEQSIFGNGVVGWDDTYYVDFSLRNDWSSTLPAANNSYLYGGLSLSAITSNFLKDVEWLDFWKVRASAAQVGSTMDPYNTEQVYVNQNKYGTLTSIRGSKNLLNPAIRPTISTSYEAGTEIRIFGGRLTADINFYTKDSKDQIINLTTTPASGFTSTKINAGLIRNSGYEIALSGTPLRTHDFEWEVYANYAANKNKLVELDPTDPENKIYQLTWFSLANRIYSYAEVGKPIGVIKGSSYDRSPDGQIVLTPLAAGHWAGDYRPLILTTDQKEFGNVQPDATGGFGTAFKWKSLRLNMTFDYQIGGSIVSVSNMFGEQSGLLASTVGNNDKGNPVRDKVADGGGIKVEGVVRNSDGSYTPASGYLDAYYWYYYKGSIWEPFVYDASYVKMRELSLTWVVPADILRKMKVGLTKADISFNIQNPWLIYSGMPNIDASEISHAYNNYVERGQTMSTRSYGLTLNLTF